MKWHFVAAVVFLLFTAAFWLAIFSRFDSELQTHSLKHFLFILFYLYAVLVFSFIVVICTMTVQFVTFDRTNHQIDSIWDDWHDGLQCCTQQRTDHLKCDESHQKNHILFTSNDESVCMTYHYFVLFVRLLFKYLEKDSRITFELTSYIETYRVCVTRWESKQHLVVPNMSERQQLRKELIWELHCHSSSSSSYFSTWNCIKSEIWNSTFFFRIQNHSFSSSNSWTEEKKNSQQMPLLY